MRKLSEKIVEAGLVPKHALQLMERWRLLDPAGVQAQEDATQEQLLSFVKEIDALLEDGTEMPEICETDLDLARQFRESAQPVVVVAEGSGQDFRLTGLTAVVGRDGRITLRRVDRWAEYAARPGSKILLEGKTFEVQSVEVRYINEVPEFYSCNVREIHAEVRALPENG